MKDKRDILRGLPETVEDDWIENVERLEAMMDEFIRLRRQARDVFELRCQAAIDPYRDRWELCSRVLSRRDVLERLSVLGRVGPSAVCESQSSAGFGR
jgi:hypothetical protein